MADKKNYAGPNSINPTSTQDDGDAQVRDAQVQDEQQFKIAESQKIGVTGAVFLILNKMIGTGSE